jgi:hypothetical protein
MEGRGCRVIVVLESDLGTKDGAWVARHVAELKISNRI